VLLQRILLVMVIARLGLNKILGSIHVCPMPGEANTRVAGVRKRAHAARGLLQWEGPIYAWRRAG